MKTPSPSAIPIPVSWLIILLSTLVIFVTGSANRKTTSHNKTIDVFEIEMGARTIVQLDSRLKEQNALENTELIDSVIEQTEQKLHEELMRLEGLTSSSAGFRRLAIVYSWLGREENNQEEKNNERISQAIRCLDNAILTRNDMIISGEIAEFENTEEHIIAIENADRIDQVMLEVLRDDRPISDAELLELKQELPWFGELFVAAQRGSEDPSYQEIESSALRASILTSLIGFLIFSLGSGSIVAWISRIWLFFTQKRSLLPIKHPSIQTSSENPTIGAIYLEAFAVYLVIDVLFLALSFVVPFSPLVSGIGLFIASLLAAFWPFLRGVSWTNFREMIGLTSGKGIFKEIFAGIYGYILIIPLMIFGILLSLGMSEIWELFGNEVQQASHPAALNVAFGGWFERILMLLLAAVFAPFFEEILFRGTFFGFLRTRYNFLISALVMSFIFAILHPQGFMAVPVLMGLSIGFAAIREARGSLIASMTAHAIHNGTLMISLMLILL